MEEKKGSGGGRMVGSKVSQIANIFQAMAPAGVKGGGEGEVLAVSPGESPKTAEGVTVVRTESHVARFNNARALFEKLGVTGSGDEPKAKSKVTDLRSRSSSTTSSVGGDSPHRTPRDPSPATPALIANQVVRTTTNGLVKTNGTHENSSNAFVKPSTVRNKDTSVAQAKVVGVKSVDSAGAMGKGARTIANGVTVGEKPAKPEKPERRLNSRELIEKQKNWTSHFSKTRTSPRYNSDPNKPAEPTTVSVNKSASFNLPRTARSPPPPHPSTPPPPPPTANSALRAETPVSSPSPTPPDVSPLPATTPPPLSGGTPVDTPPSAVSPAVAPPPVDFPMVASPGKKMPLAAQF
ncbi:regulation of protein localization to actin cortical patch [Homalodisca vitripennis]|nr:regulation of protein localization to actin cortical patch [Homalodisca vitripennis]